MKRQAAALLVSALAVTGCSQEPHSDLREFVKESENLPHGRIPPLPQVQPYEPYTYSAFDLIDPFQPLRIHVAIDSAHQCQCGPIHHICYSYIYQHRQYTHH